MSTTTFTPQQRRTQLAHAARRSKQVRAQRARTRAQIRGLPPDEARAALADLLMSCPDWLDTLPIDQLLLWLPQRQRLQQRAENLLALADIHQINKPTGTLSPRQRQVIAAALYLAPPVGPTAAARQAGALLGGGRECPGQDVAGPGREQRLRRSGGE